MKHIGDFFRNACAYTVVFLTFFYLVSLSDTVTNGAIPFGRFGLILAFGAIISAAGFLFRIKINKVYIVIIHYSALLLSFIVLFVTTKVLSSNSSSTFVAIIAFSILYALLFVAVYFAKGFFYGRYGKKRAVIEMKKKADYKPRFNGKEN